MLIGTFGVTKAWAGLTPTKREPAATAAAQVLRMENMEWAFAEVKMNETTISGNGWLVAVGAPAGCNVRVC